MFQTPSLFPLTPHMGLFETLDNQRCQSSHIDPIFCVKSLKPRNSVNIFRSHSGFFNFFRTCRSNIITKNAHFQNCRLPPDFDMDVRIDLSFQGNAVAVTIIIVGLSQQTRTSSQC